MPGVVQERGVLKHTKLAPLPNFSKERTNGPEKNRLKSEFRRARKAASSSSAQALRPRRASALPARRKLRGNQWARGAGTAHASCGFSGKLLPRF